MVNKFDTQFLIEGSNLDEDDIRAGIMASAEGDCLSHLIPASTFRQLLADYPAFAAWFQEGLAVKGQLARRGRDSELAELMVTPVGAAELAPAVRVPATMSIADASARLREERVDCLLVDDP